MSDFKFDVCKTPFSRYGSYLAISGRRGGLSIHCARRRFGDDHIFNLVFLKDGQIVTPRFEAAASVLTAEYEGAKAQFYIADDFAIAIAASGLDVRFEMVPVGRKNGDTPEEYPLMYGIEEGPGRFKMISVNARQYVLLSVFEGKGTAQGPRDSHNRDLRTNVEVKCCAGKALYRLDISGIEPKDVARPEPAKDIAKIEAEWKAFAAKLPKVAEHRTECAMLAWYNLWSSVVRAMGCYKYDAMVMSKDFMSSVWTWDHCFNALAVGISEQKTGLEQFLMPFELQASTGALPDYFNPNFEVVWGVTKPPIHGWCFGKLMDRYRFEPVVLRRVYDVLSLWTNWWMDYRDSDNDGIPDFPMGCDSGWDNSTIFDKGFFVESPELSAYLVLQMQTLERIARELKMSSDWEQRAQRLLNTLCEHNWKDERFVAPLSGSHEYEQSTCLQTLMPIALGASLDKTKFDKLVEILERDFLTQYGPATEMPTSNFYESDSYWRGPIWAPTTYLIVDGLNRGGRADLAQRIAKNFCDMIQYTAGGNYENFDALTGKGLRAPGYTWTASVNLLLMHEYGV